MRKIENIKAIVLDLDGTLLSSKLEILSETKIVLQELVKKDIIVIIASGRTPQTAIKMTKELNITAPMVLANGALIFDPKNEKVIKSDALKKEIVKSFLSLSKDINTSLNLYTPNCIYLEDKMINAYMNESGDDKENLISQDLFDLDKDIVVKCEFFGPNKGKDEKLKKIVLDHTKVLNQELYLTSAHVDFLEILNKNVNKVNGIKKVLNNLNIEEDNVLIFGDSHNDIEMLDNFSNSVAMGNAEKSVLDVAKYSTLDNNNNGIAEFIKKRTNLLD